MDFLLAHPAATVKKMGVKTHDRSHSKISADQIASLAGPASPAFFSRRPALNAKRLHGFPAGAIPIVDFLLARPAAIVKKTAVKTQDGRAKLSNAAAISARVQTPAI